MDDLFEVAGFGLIVAFLWFVWPPLVLLGAGLLLVAYAQVRAGRARGGARRALRALGAAWSAGRAEYRQRPAELRSVA